MKKILLKKSIGFIVNNVEFEFDLGKVQKNVSMGADAKCKYMSTQSGHIY